MKRLALEVTLEELTLLVTLASDQLFRNEFIDPKIPGYKADPGELDAGKSLVARLRAVVGRVPLESGSSSGNVPRQTFGHPVRRFGGIPYAL